MTKARELTISALADHPVGEVITTRGKELPADATVAQARAMLASSSIQVIPLLDGDANIGSVGRDDIADAQDDERVCAYAHTRPPMVTAALRVSDAMAVLDEDGGRRLVVLEGDRMTFVGLVCLRSDREHLCVDAECHPCEEEQRTMTSVTATARVAELVRADPSRARVFERLGIDYCCGGATPLQDACRDLGLDADDVVAQLEEPRDAGSEDIDWEAATIPELVDHIVDVHHSYLRDELEPLGALVAKVAQVHGDVHPELIDLKVAYLAVALELHEHMPKEELVLFPACVALAGGDGRDTPIDAPVRAMLDDHQEVASGLARMRRLTEGYAVPADACNSYRAMLDRMATLEADTHRHVHEENNILFPRALELASARRAPAEQRS